MEKLAERNIPHPPAAGLLPVSVIVPVL